MKKIFFTLISLCIFGSCHSQDFSKEELELLANPPQLTDTLLQKEVVEMRESIEGIGSFLAFTEKLNNTDFSIEFDSEIKEENEIRFKPGMHGEERSNQDIEKMFNDYFKGLGFEQRIFYPKSKVDIAFTYYDKDDKYYELTQMVPDDYFLKSQFGEKEMPVFIVDRINFKDGTYSEDHKKDTISIDTFGSETLEFETAKYIDNLSLKFFYSYSNAPKLTLDKNQTELKQKEGTLSLLSIKNNKVEMVMPQSLANRFLGAEGVYKDGRLMQGGSISSKSLPGDESIAYFKELQKIMQKTLIKVYKKELLNVEQTEAFIEENKPIEPEKTTGKQYKKYGFPANVEKINVLLKSEKTETITHTASIKKTFPRPAFAGDRPNIIEPNGFHLAKEESTGKKGLLGDDGTWKVKPQLDYLTRVNSFYFKGSMGEDPNELYWLNLEKGELEKVKDYTLYHEPQVFGDNIVGIEKAPNGERGLINGRTGEIIDIVPSNSSSIWFGKRTVQIAGSSKMFGLDGNEILPNVDRDGLKVVGDYFYVYKDGIIDLYDSNGKNFTQGKWKQIKGIFSKEGLLLVNPCKEYGEEEQADCSYHFVNKENEIVLTLKKEDYEKVEPFSNGLAEVRNNGEYPNPGWDKWGYINTKGELVIPYEYGTTYFFQTNFAYVTKDRKDLLINKKNEVIIELPSSLSWSDFDYKMYGFSNHFIPDGTADKVILSNGEIYNDKGEKVDEK